MKLSEELTGRKVASYYFIDRTGRSNGGPVKPSIALNEVITYESEHFGDHTENWLVHRYNGEVIKMMNVVETSQITFEV